MHVPNVQMNDGGKRMIESCLVLGLLGVCSIEDIKSREIGVYKIYFLGILGILLHIFSRKISVYSILGGMLIGILILILGKLTGGSVGIGDGLILIDTGVLLGSVDNLKLFCGGIFLAGIAALILLVFFRKNKKYELPFIPFLFITYVGMLLCG